MVAPENSHLCGYSASQGPIHLCSGVLTVPLLFFLTITPGEAHLKASLCIIFNNLENTPAFITFANPEKHHLYSRPNSPHAFDQSCITSPSAPVNAHRKCYERLVVQWISLMVNNLFKGVLQVNTNNSCVPSIRKPTSKPLLYPTSNGILRIKKRENTARKWAIGDVICLRACR